MPDNQPQPSRRQERQQRRLQALARKPSAKFPSGFKTATTQEKTKTPVSRPKVSALRHRPAKTVRIFSPNNQLPLLLDTPIITPGLSSEYPVPEWFRRTTPADVSVIVPLYRSNPDVVDLINSWEWSDLNVEIIFVDDNCPLDSKQAVIDAWNKKRHPVGKLIVNQENQGYGGACNVGAHYATGKYLIFLNADTRVTPNWIEPLVESLQDESIGIVGNLQIKEGGDFDGSIDGAGSEWRWDDMCFVHIGRHSYKGKNLVVPYRPENAPRDIMIPAEREMVTGCCFGIRRDLFLEIGGFNPNYKIGYWEDSEICMTVREAGYRIWYRPESIVHHKLGHSNAGGHKYQNYNRNYFFNKWVHSNRIDKLLPKNKRGANYNVGGILLQRMGANGDVLMAAAVAPALKKMYPQAAIVFYTECPEVVKGNPYIDKVVTNMGRIQERTVQLFYNLDMAYEYRPRTNILKAYADLVGVKTEDCRLSLRTTTPNFELPSKYVVVHAGRTNWVGRDWNPERFVELSERLRAAGKTVVNIGRAGEHGVPCDYDLRGKTSINELAYVIRGAEAFVGIDSLPMHIAQTFDVPGVCFFGCINPNTRIISPRMQGITALNLACLGCHHRRPTPCTVTNVCETGTLDCVNNLTVDGFWKAIRTLLQIA